MKAITQYIGLKDFARGVQKLYKVHGNVPVFVEVDGNVAPFGIALQEGNLLNGEAIAFCGVYSKPRNEFKKGTVTE